MNIQYLGTAAAEGWPAVFCKCEACKRAAKLGGKDIRTRSQALIDGKLLIDFPPDAYWHAIRFGFVLGDIESLLVTHSHQDHFYPLELIMRGSPYAHQQKGCLTIYGNSSVKRLYEIALAEENDVPNISEVVSFQIVKTMKSFSTKEGYQVTPLPASHKENELCLVFLIEKDGKRIFYGNDSGFYKEEVWDFLEGIHLDIISLDSTMGKFSGGTGHMGISENIRAYKRFKEIGCVNETTKVVVNHFSHNGLLSHSELEDMVRPYGFIVAYDGMVLEV